MHGTASLTGVDVTGGCALLTGGGTAADPPDTDPGGGDPGSGTLNEWITPFVWMNDYV